MILWVWDQIKIKPPLSSCIKSGTAAMEKQVFEYGLMLASANPNSGTVGPSPLEKYRVSEIKPNCFKKQSSS